MLAGVCSMHGSTAQAPVQAVFFGLSGEYGDALSSEFPIKETFGTVPTFPKKVCHPLADKFTWRNWFGDSPFAAFLR